MSYLTMRLHISQTSLLFNEYLLIDLSLRMTMHIVSNVIDSTHFNTLRGDFRSIDIKFFSST